MSRVDVDAVLNGLKGFQRDAVAHVIDRFYGEGSHTGSGRFLIADETGLGKSVVARGVIAKAIQHLERDDDVDRIDVVYICSNADLANQNLRRLNVTGDQHLAMSTRLTLLARESHRLSADAPLDGKKVNLVSFTPGTSFKEGGWRQGSKEERALLATLLDRLTSADASDRRASRVLLRGAVRSLDRFTRFVDDFARDLDADGGADERIVEAFAARIRSDGTWDRFLDVRAQTRDVEILTDDAWHRAADLTATLRQHLAFAGVDALEPDLVILDEFQRFRHLLDPNASEASALADNLFSHGRAKVLLLSATPYKPFTTTDDADDDHARDFLATVRFLARGDHRAVEDIEEALRRHRENLVHGSDASESATAVRRALLPLMSRSERPPLSTSQDMVVERPLDGGVPSADEIADWVALQQLAQHIDARIDIEHWKSIPYFATFMDTYRSGSRTRALLDADDGAAARLLAAAASVAPDDVEHRRAIEHRSGLLRSLAGDTIGRGWWKLLWMPPSMPYLEPGPVYGSIEGDVTKHVVFSSWNGVPTAISALLSHEAERRATATRSNDADGSDSTLRRLGWRLTPEGRPASMSTLALFWPHPALAERHDPLAFARASGAVATADAVAATRDVPDSEGTGEAWEAFFATPGRAPTGTKRITSLVGRATRASAGAAPIEDDGAGNLATYVRHALDVRETAESTHPDLGVLGAHAPGAIAYRAMRSVAGDDASPNGLWSAAWQLSLALRALFDRPATALLIDQVTDSESQRYWRSVLDYCADGNLQAVLDEYLYQLRSELGGGLLDDEGLAVAAQMASSALRLTTATLQGHDATADRVPIRFRTRFAVRYGGKHTDADAAVAARQSDVRAAFNSPFAPFVLASTSVGQEGIDFHWWSHAVVHWNLPSNPVDFEQREGRVHRFMGHAVRKNVAERHRHAALNSDGPAWDAAFAAAEQDASSLGEFAPWWVYPGDARIQRRIATFTLSREHARYERLRHSLTLYRLTLGQARQEDMLHLLEQRGLETVEGSAIDLRPPRS